MANVDVTRIASNIGALNALNSLQQINSKLAMHQTRLSTGKRINSAADDPAGLTIATKMLARSEGLKVALNNIGDANNMLSVAEAGLSKMNDILVQMRSKAEQAASDTLGTTERQAIQTQLSAYAEQIDNIVAETKWNSTKLLDGTVSKQFQTGVDAGESTTWSLTQDHGAGATGLRISTDVSTSQVDKGTNIAAANGLTDIQTFAVNSNYSSLETGQYQIALDAAATSLVKGKIVSAGTFANNNLTLGVTDLTAGRTGEIANGFKDIKFKNLSGAGAAGGTFQYSLDGGSTYLTTAAFNSAAGVTIDLTDTTAGAGNKIGISVIVSAAAADADLGSASQTTTVDYVKAGYAKAELQTAEGENVTVDNNGTPSSTFYLNGNTTNTGTDLGRGVKAFSATWAQMDAGVTAGNTFAFGFTKANAYSVDVSTADNASTYMNTVNTAMNTVNNSMASLGSLMARLSFKEEQVSNAQINVEGAYSRIMNANMAEEQMNASKYTILQQTAVAMLAQANQAPQSLLTLFR